MNRTLKSDVLNYYLCLLQRETKLVAKFLQGNIFSEMHAVTEVHIGLFLLSEGSAAQIQNMREEQMYIVFFVFDFFFLFTSKQILS